jgi:hypothetical protein
MIRSRPREDPMVQTKEAERPKVSESQIKAMLSASDKVNRAAGAKMARATVAQHARVQSAAKRLLVPYWKKSGLDIKGFENIQVKAQTEMRRSVKGRKVAAVKNSSSVRERLRGAAANWLQSVNRLRGPNANLSSPFIPEYQVLETPFLIWPTHGLELDDSQIAPGNNWAKIKMPQTGASSGNENLRFIFVWQNPKDSYAAINIASLLALNGTCELTADSGFAGIVPGGTSSLTLDAYLKVWEWWNQPPTVPILEPTQQNEALNVSANGGGWFSSVGAIEVWNVQGDYAVSYDQFLLPPNGVTVIEVTLLVSYSNESGTAELDFSSGGFEVFCPEIAIATLT